MKNLEPDAATDKIARVAKVRPAAEAFAKNDEEMLSAMLRMSPSARVREVDLLRVRLGGLTRGGTPTRMRRVVKVLRRGAKARLSRRTGRKKA